jgi:hypothetical protein
LVATAAGEQTAAATSFAEALRLLEEQQLHIDLAETRIELARAMRMFGDEAGARAELERARGGFSRMGAATIVAAIDSDLSELAERAGASGPLRL